MRTIEIMVTFRHPFVLTSATGAVHQVVNVDPVEWGAVVEADGRH